MKRDDTIPALAAVLVIAVMVGTAELSGEREIIFPEIAAIAVGMLLSPRRSWRTDRRRVLLLISLAAALGLGVSVLLPGPLWGKMTLAYVLGQGILLCSGTSFAPLLSAAVLPVLLGTRSAVYLAAAVGLTGLILLLSALLERQGLRPREAFSPLPPPGRRDLPLLLARCLLGAGCVCLALRLGLRFAVAPPLLVAFTEWMAQGSPARQKPFRTLGLIVLCAAAGALCRLGLTMGLGLSLTVSALAASLLLLLLLKGFGMYLPPAGALGILAMLIPAESLWGYPLQVLCGAAVLMALAWGYGKIVNS